MIYASLILLFVIHYSDIFWNYHVTVFPVLPKKLEIKYHSISLKNIKYLCAQLFCCVHLFATPWTIAHQAPLSMRFSMQKYWSEMPFPSPGIKYLLYASLGYFIPSYLFFIINYEISCHPFLQIKCWGFCVCVPSHSVMYSSLWPHGL